MKTLLASLVLLGSFNVFAHDHTQVDTIRGSDVTLQVIDHAIAGNIKNAVVMGHFSHEKFAADMTLRFGEKTFESHINSDNGKPAGTLSTTTEQGMTVVTEMQFVKFVKAPTQNVGSELHFTLNGEPMTV